MKTQGSYEVAASPEKVFAYYADPRHLVVANHKGPVVEQSEGEQGAGSWYILAFDNLRVRVEYTVFDPPNEIAARVIWSGRGSGRAASENNYRIAPLDDGSRSRIHVIGEGRGGFISIGPVVRFFAWLQGRRIKRAIERST